MGCRPLLGGFRRCECYWAPLKPEAAESTHFLETTLELDPSGSFRTRLKNVNEECEAVPRVWRYHRWDSFTLADRSEEYCDDGRVSD